MRLFWTFILLFTLSSCHVQDAPKRRPAPSPNHAEAESILQSLQENGGHEQTREIENDKTIALPALSAVESKPIPRAVLSQFATPDEEKKIRVSVALRGFSNSEEIEDQIWKILSEHAPHPWNLQKGSSLDKKEKTWGTIRVDVQRHVRKIRRGTKTTPPLYKLQYTFAIAMALPDNQKSSWQRWNYTLDDEMNSTNEAPTHKKFWSNVQSTLPTLVIWNPKSTAKWLRSQGLPLPNENLDVLHVDEHRYFESGCLISRTTPQTHELRLLQSPWSVPQTLDIPHLLEMACTRDAVYIAAQESPKHVVLYAQQLHDEYALKTRVTFQDPIDGFHIHLDDDLLCLYTGLLTSAKSSEIQCFDRKTGMLRWKTKPSGALRGFAAHASNVTFATEKAIYTISREGKILDVQATPNTIGLRNALSCQLDKRLIMMTGVGQFRAWNLETQTFDWQTAVLDAQFIHCGLDNIVLLSETGGYLLAFDVESQTPLWKYRTVSLPKDALFLGESIYLLMNRAMIILDRRSGALKAQIPIPWDAQNFIAVRSRLYIDAKNALYTWR